MKTATMTTATKTEEQIEIERRAAWAVANPDRCPNCGGTGTAWDFIYALGYRVLDKCVDCDGTGKAD